MAGNLYISLDFGRPSPTDDGTRPFPGTTPYWDNASIFLDPPRPTQTQAETGNPSTIKVRVSNKGPTTVRGVRVRAYVMTPQIGLANTGQSLVTFLSDAKDVPPGTGSALVTDSHVFDCLLAGQPWIPTDAQFAASGNGHFCLLANCFQDPGFADPPLEGRDLSSTETFDLKNDQHQGQRNIQLVQVAQMRLAEPVQVDFDVNPPPPPERVVTVPEPETTIEVAVLPPEEVTGPSEVGILTNWTPPAMRMPPITLKADPGGSGREGLFLTSPGGEEVPLRVSRRQLEFQLEAPGLEPGLQAGLEPGLKFGWERGLRRRLALPMPATREITRARVALNLDPAEPVGSLHAFDVVQRTQDGTALGGLRVLVLVTA